MTDPTPYLRRDFDAELARIERQQEETRNFVAEQQKRMDKADRRDRWLPLLTAVVVILCSTVLGVLIRLPEILQVLGIGR